MIGLVLGTFLVLSGLSGLIYLRGDLGLVTAFLAVAAGVMVLVYTPGNFYSGGLDGCGNQSDCRGVDQNPEL